jgi:hypothetical protein
MKCFDFGLALAALLAPVRGWSADSPSLQGEVLFLPRVDTPEQVGLYQNGTLRRNADGTWSLISIQALGEGDLSKVLNVGQVVVHSTESIPAAVYLKVTGAEARCGFSGTGKVHQRRAGSNFDISISTSLTLGALACPAAMNPYQFIVPLDVYGLPMGTYTFNVHGVRGMFTLQRNNRFADDCSPPLGCPLP